MAVKWRDYKCSPYIARRYKVLVEIMLDDVIVSIFLGVGLIVQLLMGRKQPWPIYYKRRMPGMEFPQSRDLSSPAGTYVNLRCAKR